MSFTIACQRGRMGSTDYYVAKLKAGTLVNLVGFASQLPEWDDMDIDEVMQRELQTDRVIDEIVPFLVEDKDRFFGALIVDIFKGWENTSFESLADIVPKFPKAYLDQTTDLGFLTIPSNQSLIALDGQHRLLALNIAIKGWNAIPPGKKLTEEDKLLLKPHPDLVDEDIVAIFVPHTDNIKIRKIFNKVNRYAKQTSRGDNIITSEDDIFAIIARRLVKYGEPLAPINDQPLVNLKSNTIATRSKNLTTLSALYSFSEEVLKNDTRLDKKKRPAQEVIEKKYSQIAEVWQLLLEGLDDFQQYVDIVEGTTEQNISELRSTSLLLKPVTHMALGVAIRQALARKITLPLIISRLNKISWNFANPVWSSILVFPGQGSNKVLTGKENIRNAGRLIEYMIAGESFSEIEKDDLQETIRSMSYDQERELPSVIG